MNSLTPDYLARLRFDAQQLATLRLKSLVLKNTTPKSRSESDVAVTGMRRNWIEPLSS